MIEKIIYISFLLFFICNIFKVVKFIKNRKGKVRMFRFTCSYCLGENELIVKGENSLFFSKLTPWFFIYAFSCLIIIFILSGYSIYVKRILLIILAFYLGILLICGSLYYHVNSMFKKGENDINNKLIDQVIKKLFFIRKSCCTHCGKDNYRVSGF